LARRNNIIIYYAGTSAIILLHFELMELKYYYIFTIDSNRFNYYTMRFLLKSICSTVIVLFTLQIFYSVTIFNIRNKQKKKLSPKDLLKTVKIFAEHFLQLF